MLLLNLVFKNKALVQRFKNWLLKPFYIWEYTTRRKIIFILLIELFSIGFKVFYQPEFLKLPVMENLYFYISHGLVNILVLWLFLFIIPRYSGFFSEERRTILSEALLIILLFISLTYCHAVLIIFDSNMTLGESLAESLIVNLKIGVFPIALLLILASVRGMEIKLEQQELYNARYLDTSAENEMIQLRGKSDTIKLRLGDLYFIKSSNVYSEIYFEQDGRLTKVLLRAPISAIEQQLDSEFVFRVHRSYIVNFLNYKKVIGNANKCSVLLKKENIRIPVSRVKRSEMFHRLDKLPIAVMA